MNLIKHSDFFNPINIEAPIHIIGIGAIGSQITMQLTRLGCDNLHLYDFDIVEDKNIANQNYFYNDIKVPKTAATLKNIWQINPTAKAKTYDQGYNNQNLSGYVFLCVDSIETRHKIATQHKFNPNIKAMFDFRMGLSDAQHYAADWTDDKQKDNFLKTMNFTHEEAQAAQPVSACGTTLAVLPTILIITSVGVANFINYIKGKELKGAVIIDAFDFQTVIL